MSYIDEISEIGQIVFQNISEKKGQSFVNLWYKDLKIHSFSNNTVVFSLDSEFKYEQLKKNHIEALEDEFSALLPCKVDIIFTGKKTDAQAIKEVIYGEEPKREEKQTSIIDDDINQFNQIHNPDYTFDNFIVGSSNKFAHAACTAVAQKPAMDYNPLFIYGPSGLGKTHLICAIINEIKKKKPDTKVMYVSGEEFTNQLIESISKKETLAFHNKFRSCDILLIDDNHFIAGKESTQETFFHTFNALYQDQKQIILTSDRPPKDIATLEERLRTRFEWGLIADIQPPDLELRIAILKKKVEEANIAVPEDVLLFLAENLRSNIRQIVGAIKKLSAKSLIMNQTINMELAKSCINELLGGSEPISTTIDKIFSAVFKKYDVPKEDIKGKKRVKNITWARQVTIYLVREITELSFPDIGDIVDKDHSTVIYSYNMIVKKMAADPMTNVEIEGLMKEIIG